MKCAQFGPFYRILFEINFLLQTMVRTTRRSVQQAALNEERLAEKDDVQVSSDIQENHLPTVDLNVAVSGCQNF